MRPNALAEIREALAPMMERSISALMAQYRIGHAEADYLHDQLWMHAHGIAAMKTGKKFKFLASGFLSLMIFGIILWMSMVSCTFDGWIDHIVYNNYDI